MQKFLHFLEEKIKKNVAKNLIQNGRYQDPKLNLLVKTTNHLFSNKFSQKFKMAPTFNM
jgi:hypothetical protein